LIEAVFAGLFGLLIGSFLNVCIYRIPNDLSVVGPRSFCPTCRSQVAWFDNVPVLTWIFLRGRCRHCSTWIPVRYPIVEALTGVIFFAAVYAHGLTLLAFKVCLLSAILIALAFTDLEYLILPDEFTKPGIVAGLVLAYFVHLPFGVTPLIMPPDIPEGWFSVAEAAIGAILPAAILWAVGSLWTRLRGIEALGFGDVKLIALLGAFLGLHGALFATVIGSLAGSIIGVLWIVLKRREWTFPLPFGTFLSFAGIVTVFWTTATWPLR
jgi:leader peptidase (prepilin peptidase)/N-methyltransferase